MRDGHLLKRAGREFAKNLIWMAVVFGSLAAVLVAAPDLPLVGVMAFVGVYVAVMAAIVTVAVLWNMDGSKLLEDEDGSKLPEEDCSKLPEDGKPTRDIALARCDCLIDQYLRWKKENLRNSNRAQRAALIFTAITPVLLLIPWDYVNLLGAAASAMAAIATGLLAISSWRENYIRYGYVWHALQSERYRYLTHATEEYSDSDKEEKAARNFASRIEQLVMAEVTDWQALMERVEQQNRNGSPADQV